MTVPVGTYERISDDVAGEALGVKRQWQDNETVCRLRGWEPAKRYTDNSVSAFKRGVLRPAFEEMLDDLENGAIGGVVAYDLDRLARQPRDLERVIDIYDRRPGLVFATVQGDVDLASADGRTMARVMVAFANKSSMDTSRRIRRKHLELAQLGVPVGGTRPFGWKDDHVSLDPAESSLVRQAAEDVLLGVGIHTIVRRWNEAGVRTSRGNPWKTQTLRQMLKSPRLAGYRVHQGQIAIDPSGQRVTGKHEPILEVPVWEELVARMETRSTRAHGRRKYLLSGVARCSECNAMLRGNAAPNKYPGNFYYVCPAPTQGGCGKVGISGRGTDEAVTRVVLAALADREIDPSVESWHGERRLRELETKIEETFTAYSSGKLSGERAFPVIARMEDEVRALRAERDRVKRVNVEAVTGAVSVAERWESLETEQRREIVSTLLSAVVVRPARKRGGQFDVTRIETYPR